MNMFFAMQSLHVCSSMGDGHPQAMRAYKAQSFGEGAQHEYEEGERKRRVRKYPKGQILNKPEIVRMEQNVW